MQGVVCSGVAYYLQAVIMKARGPVFVTAFNPLTMVIVAILGSFVLSEVLYLGRYMSVPLLQYTPLHTAIENVEKLHNFPIMC